MIRKIIFILNWITSGNFIVDWSIRLDTLTAVMFIVVTTVSACVHLYSIGYMEEDPSKIRFMGYLSLLLFLCLFLYQVIIYANVFWLGRCWIGFIFINWFGTIRFSK